MDRLVGAEDHDLEGETPLRDYSPAWYDALKDLPSVGAGGGSGANNAYPEELITLSPDVILAGFSDEAVTVLGRKRPGDIVNLETDLIGKYVRRIMQCQADGPATPQKSSGINKEFLLQNGFL